ncbi:MAG: type IV pilus modification PilV family protein [Caulobacteraceae bacterium]
MLNKYLSDKRGISLVEVLVAAALITFVFAGFVNAFYYGTNLKSNSQKKLQAVLQAQTFFEEVRSARGEVGVMWSDKAELQEWLQDVKYFTDAGSGRYVKDNMTVTLTSPYAGTPSGPELEHLIAIHVEVSYQDEFDKSQSKTVSLETRLRELDYEE